MKKAAIILFIFVVTGCTAWTKVTGPYESPSLRYTADLPEGWMKYAQGNTLLLSKDGVTLQNILVNKEAIDADLEFTKKRFEPQMFPQDAAEVYLDNERMNLSKHNFEVVRNMLSKVSDVLAFDVEYTYNTAEGLKIRTCCRGLVRNGYFYQISYTAPDRYYYKKDLDAYNAVLEGFQFMPEN